MNTPRLSYARHPVLRAMKYAAPPELWCLRDEDFGWLMLYCLYRIEIDKAMRSRMYTIWPNFKVEAGEIPGGDHESVYIAAESKELQDSVPEIFGDPREGGV